MPSDAMIVRDETGTVIVRCPDGSRVEIREGCSKTLILRKDSKLHLLDCVCELCASLRDQAL